MGMVLRQRRCRQHSTPPPPRSLSLSPYAYPPTLLRLSTYAYPPILRRRSLYAYPLSAYAYPPIRLRLRLSSDAYPPMPGTSMPCSMEYWAGVD
eukprot:294610-Rhodomonas_salina.1